MSAETLERLVPETISIMVDGKLRLNCPVTGVVAHPPGTHELSPIRNEYTAVEIKTFDGSRWYGFERAWIGSDLRMHVAPIRIADEVVRGWELPDDEGDDLEWVDGPLAGTRRTR